MAVTTCRSSFKRLGPMCFAEFLDLPEERFGLDRFCYHHQHHHQNNLDRPRLPKEWAWSSL